MRCYDAFGRCGRPDSAGEGASALYSYAFKRMLANQKPEASVVVLSITALHNHMNEPLRPSAACRVRGLSVTPSSLMIPE